MQRCCLVVLVAVFVGLGPGLDSQEKKGDAKIGPIEIEPWQKTR